MTITFYCDAENRDKCRSPQSMLQFLHKPEFFPFIGTTQRLDVEKILLQRKKFNIVPL